ncbi:MAG: hypothetical protein K5912_03245 [Alphaproteobacteria bacterium]|nr:hypothetical protein [Alphaproteobacteria bacterium]
MANTKNIKAWLLMGLATLIMASCGNQKKDSVKNDDFNDRLNKEKVANGYDSLAREDTDTTMELEQIDSIVYQYSFAHKIHAEYESAAARVVRDADNKLKSLLNSYGIKETKDVLFSTYYLWLDGLAAKGRYWDDFSGAHWGMVEKLAEQAGVSEANILKLGVGFGKISEDAHARVCKIEKSIQARYEKSHGIVFVLWPSDMASQLMIEQGDSTKPIPENKKLSKADEAKIDSLWNVIKHKRELSNKKDSLLNAAWSAAQRGAN